MSNIEFELTYAALKMFGKQLYSNVGSAISELVANGLDAKANNIYISINVIDRNNATVEIFDDGIGMSPDDIQRNYIRIGYNKRVPSLLSDNKTLGRKGIGKLAALYLSDCFTIATKKSSDTVSVWKLDVSQIGEDQKPQLVQQRGELPNELQCLEKWKKSDSGTLIYLQNVNFAKVGDRALESLEYKLSNYFLYDKLDKAIWINIIKEESDKGKFTEITKKIAFRNMAFIYTDNVKEFELLEHSKYKIPYVDKLGNKKEFSSETQIADIRSVLSPEEIKGEYKGVPYALKGWIGIHSSINKETAEKNDPLYIKNQFYNPNQLRVYVRNKLGMSNMLEHLGNTRAFANYIEGEIIFDILDDDSLNDIATAGRQDFDTQDERFVILKDLMVKIGNSLVTRRQELADKIKKQREVDDKKISSNAKAIFSRELHKELANIEGMPENSKVELETIITNKLQGNIDIEAKAQYTIFISHASKDNIISDFLYNYLKSLGFRGDLSKNDCEIFYSSSGLDTDNLEPLSKVIRDAIIDKNNDILFLTSSNFNKSPFCLFEGGAAWATRAIGEYKIISLQYSDIPIFLTNGKGEISLNIKCAEDFVLDGIRYNQIIAVINRVITHLNKNREAIGADEVTLLSKVDFPDAVELKRQGKTIFDYMDKTFLEYWNEYILLNAADYFKIVKRE